jgi:alkane 1-monooxygenase
MSFVVKLRTGGARPGINGMMLRYSLPFCFLATVPLGFTLGGGWCFLTVLAMPLAIAGLDGAFGSASESAGGNAAALCRMLPRLYIPLQIATTAWVARTISGADIDTLRAIGLTLSVGFSAGVFGMLAAHEMAHSTTPRDRALGLCMLASVGYMHFAIAHVHGHHRRAATALDPATARQGESVYLFVVRSAKGQFAESWTWEARRLQRQGRGAFDRSNRMLRYGAVEAMLVLVIATLGARALAFFLIQAVVAIVLLELFNYIAHYGLERRGGPDGRPERLAAVHSWNSRRRMNNWSLFNMGCHSDHHRFPMRSYEGLEATAGAPELPTGYAGAILLALIPPLWRRVMDPRAKFWNGRRSRGLQAQTQAIFD